MATERDIARLLNEEIGPQDSDYVALVLGDYFCDETSETDYEAVEDMEEEVEEGKEEEKETKDCDEDINPPLFDPEVAVELQVSDLDLESAMPDAPATSTTHSGDDMRKEDLHEEEELSKFFEHGCGCSDNCYALFSHSYIKTYRCDIQAMAKPVQEIAIMSQMAATSTMGGLSTGNHRRQKERKRQFFTFMHQGHKICRVTFLKLHACGKSRFEEIIKNYRMNGLIPRVHGNAGKTPNHALTYDDILRVVAFIRNYAEVHGISLPGRIPGMKSYENKKFLPCSTSKRQNHGLNSVSIHFNADNCTGQNKNNTVIQYLLWRVMTGLNASISISFLPVGHTKFSPDWCFGLLKQKFRKAEVDSLDDFIQVVEQSSAVNKAQPVGSSNGELIVETLDWCSYFATLFKKIKGIKGFQHFVVNATSPGVVAARQTVDGPVTQFNLLKEDAQIMEDELPNILPPKGMSTERKWYLYKKIRSFCRYECKDVTCPLPDAPRPTGSSRQSTPGVDNPPDLAMEIEVPHSPRQSLEPPATQRKCGNCGQFGHNRRTCPCNQ
uniref:CCHC-type domain-containing protein n=1 Tax=Amphimedon queenslandica TaxID=400682 RepID=A0A1X7U668_AMPQE